MYLCSIVKTKIKTMKSEITQMEFDIPQLRQMVLENTDRIEKNESVINRMGVEATEQTHRISALEEWLENSRREREREMRDSRERMAWLEKFAADSRIEHEKRIREIREEWKETGRQVKEMFAETRKEVKAMFAETHEEVKAMSAETRKFLEEMSVDTRKKIDEMSAETHRFLEEMSVDTRKKIDEMSAETRKFKEEMAAETCKFKEAMSAETHRFLEEMSVDTRKKIDEMSIETRKFKEEMSAETCKFKEAMAAETRKFLEEMSVDTRKKIDEMSIETRKKVEEISAETRKNVEESGKTRENMNKMIADANAFLRRFSIEFLGVTGHIVEGLVSSSTENVFKKAGFILHNSGKNLKRGLDSENKQMEVDVILGNEKVVVPVEVKTNFTKKKVKRFVHKMELFRSFFPECADKEVVAAVAAINYDTDADVLAHEEGLLVIRVSSDDIFTLDPVDEKQLRKF